MDENTYNRLSYVESNGNSYVLTDVIVGGNSFDFTIEFTCLSDFSSTNGMYGCIFGARQASTNRDYQLTSFRANGTTRNGTLRYGNSNNQIDAQLIKDATQKCSLKNGVYTAPDRTTTEITLTADETTPCPIAIFALNENGTISQNGKMRLYYFKVTGTNKSAEYFPAQRKSDGVVGLYEEISDTFIVPSGDPLIRGEIYGTDDLVLYGTEYDDVAGFKAKDGNGNTLTYMRKNIVVTETQNASGTQMDITLQNEVRLQAGKQVTLTSSPQTITPDTGYDGMTSVEVPASYEDAILERNLTSYTNSTITTIGKSALRNFTTLETVSCSNVASLENDSIRECTNLQTVSMPNLSVVKGSVFYGCSKLETLISNHFYAIGANAFQNCSKLNKIFVLKRATGYNEPSLDGNCFNGCSLVSAVDISVSIMRGGDFNNCAALETIILRRTSISLLGNTNVLNGTPFASGGTGGTIYIPKTLYDHLGDGTSSDYKAATNWSTVDGYGTITWAKIEGSYYETHYADGTTIPTT